MSNPDSNPIDYVYTYQSLGKALVKKALVTYFCNFVVVVVVVVVVYSWQEKLMTRSLNCSMKCSPIESMFL